MGDETSIGFERVDTKNEEAVTAFCSLCIDYLAVIMPDRSVEQRRTFRQSMLDRQREPDRWLILLRHEGNAIGFVHAKIDRDERPGWGYILEFYVVPEMRRTGMGRLLYGHIAEIFRARAISQVWLSSHPKAEIFWQSVGFHDTGEFEGHQKVMASDIIHR